MWLKPQVQNTTHIPMMMQVMPHLDDESNPGDSGEGNITLFNHVSEPIIDKIYVAGTSLLLFISRQ